jgi:cell wall-associated NlpC family hydrolase
VAVDYAARARALAGTRFRLQGRGHDGLDCVGVVLETFGLAAETIRRNYSLKGDHEADVRRGLAEHFREISVRKLSPGDVMLMKVADDQLHLAVRTAAGFVHAHAGIGRVVETPGLPEWPLLAAYRKRRSR